MNATSTLLYPVEIRPDVHRHSDEDAAFSTLIAQHTIDLPGTEWLTRLELHKPRENVRCLSLSLRFWKRAFDIFAALFLLIATSPLTVTAAILVKLTSPGRLSIRRHASDSIYGRSRRMIDAPSHRNRPRILTAVNRAGIAGS